MTFFFGLLFLFLVTFIFFINIVDCKGSHDEDCIGMRRWTLGRGGGGDMGEKDLLKI